MRILHTVEYYAPSRGGAQEVVRQISERLAARGHEVTVATTRLPSRTTRRLNGVAIEEFSLSQGDVARYHELLLSPRFDVVMNYAAQAWTTDAVFPVLEHVSAARLMAPCGFSGLHWPHMRLYFALLPLHLRRYERLIFHSDTYQDIQFAREYGLDNIAVIPNGVAMEEFAAPRGDFRALHDIDRDTPLLLSIGTHTGSKGHREAIKAFQRAKVGRAVLVIVGNTPDGGGGCYDACVRRAKKTRLRTFFQRRVLLLNVSREETLAALETADLFVFLSNIECSPLVLFESAAAGLPFLASRAGNAQEIAEWTGCGEIVESDRSEDGFWVPRINDASRKIEQLLADKERRRAMGERGRAAVQARFTWDRLAAMYEAEYERAIAIRRASAVPRPAVVPAG